MSRRFYSHGHYLRVSPPADTPEAIAERGARKRAEERVRVERAERYPNVTTENVDEISAWQERRLLELIEMEMKHAKKATSTNSSPKAKGA